jgi:large subunit ribosomal protein L30
MSPARHAGGDRREVLEHGAGALRVTQTRSSIGSKPKHRGTLRALGLRRTGASNVLPDRPEIRGMLARVTHLVEVEPAGGGHLEEAQS